MKKINLFKLFIISFLLLSGCSNTQNKPLKQKTIAVAQKIANAGGFTEWNTINAISFTFNVKIGEKEIHRSWYWEPKNDIVKFYSQNKKDSLVFSRAQISKNSSPEILKKDRQFINDSYWLLFPFHLVWDKNVTVTLQKETAALPIGNGQAKKVIVTYTSDKGYTPNDSYELYIDDNYRIIEWAYHKNNSPAPTRLTKWEDYKNIGKLNLSLNRPGKDDNFRVWFTNVRIE